MSFGIFILTDIKYIFILKKVNTGTVAISSDYIRYSIKWLTHQKGIFQKNGTIYCDLGRYTYSIYCGHFS